MCLVVGNAPDPPQSRARYRLHWHHHSCGSGMVYSWRRWGLAVHGGLRWSWRVWGPGRTFERGAGEHRQVGGAGPAGGLWVPPERGRHRRAPADALLGAAFPGTLSGCSWMRGGGAGRRARCPEVLGLWRGQEPSGGAWRPAGRALRSSVTGVGHGHGGLAENPSAFPAPTLAACRKLVPPSAAVAQSHGLPIPAWLPPSS